MYMTHRRVVDAAGTKPPSPWDKALTGFAAIAKHEHYAIIIAERIGVVQQPHYLVEVATGRRF
jgi:hypothetical protein